MKKNNDKPKLRFPGFTDPWEQRKLGDVVERVTRKNKDLESTLPLTISAQNGLVDQNVFFNKTVASRDVSGYYLVKNGEFAYNKSYSNGYPWGAVKRLDRYDMGVLSTIYIVFNPTDVNSDFLTKYYDTTYWYRQVSKHAAEGARNHGLLNIAASDFFETELTIPKDKAEQKKIGQFFKDLDNLIALHQRKLNHLQDKKKSLLQKMFPKNGEDFPELRFPGFTDPWEQRKLKQLANFAKGQGYSKNDLTDVGTPIILYGRLYTKYQSSISEVDTFAVPQSGSVYSTGEEVIVPASGETAEDIARASAVVKSGFLLGGDLNIIYPNKDISTIFLAMLISNGKQQKELSKMAQGKSVVHLHNSDLEEVTISFPCREEQERIGSVFVHLDTLITLHQRKLNHLKEQKKALLQQMFI
ncbi:restriction endonuclease subunit S [Clostridium tyrobutyricum]|uniref:restriction endonuclease subunit S n=1 Tax=Clostridium tyrobutyricum TaxID=1519 RepID=UPI0030D29EF6